MIRLIATVPPAAVVLASVLTTTPAHGNRGFGVSTNPDTQTSFVWTGATAHRESGMAMMLLVQNGGRRYEVNLSPSVSVHFARSDLKRIKWCSYSVNAPESPKTAKKCTPASSLKPDGEISIP